MENGIMTDHYSVLHLPSGDEGSRLSLKDIERAFREQSRLRHPDKRPGDPNATADFQSLTFSFNILRDVASRRNFDARLRSQSHSSRPTVDDKLRRKLASDLEEREQAAATVSPEEAKRRWEKTKAAELAAEINELLAQRKAAVRRAEMLHRKEAARPAETQSGGWGGPLPGTTMTDEEFNNYESYVLSKLRLAAERQRMTKMKP